MRKLILDKDELKNKNESFKDVKISSFLSDLYRTFMDVDIIVFKDGKKIKTLRGD